jgi:hypothetical protein
MTIRLRGFLTSVIGEAGWLNVDLQIFYSGDYEDFWEYPEDSLLRE